MSPMRIGRTTCFGSGPPIAWSRQQNRKSGTAFGMLPYIQPYFAPSRAGPKNNLVVQKYLCDLMLFRIRYFYSVILISSRVVVSTIFLLATGITASVRWRNGMKLSHHDSGRCDNHRHLMSSVNRLTTTSKNNSDCRRHRRRDTAYSGGRSLNAI